MNRTTMTIRVPLEVHDKLARLSLGTKRSRSYLAGEAVAAYVKRELAIISGIETGLTDVAAGRTVPHDQAMGQIDAIIVEARARAA